MPFIKIEEKVKIGDITRVSGTYELPDTIPCPLGNDVKMKYNEETGKYETDKLGGVVMKAEDFVKNQICGAKRAEEEQREKEQAQREQKIEQLEEELKAYKGIVQAECPYW